MDDEFSDRIPCNFFIEFSRDPAEYSPGEVLSGSIIIQTKKKIPISNVTVEICGETGFRWPKNEETGFQQPNNEGIGSKWSNNEETGSKWPHNEETGPKWPNNEGMGPRWPNNEETGFQQPNDEETGLKNVKKVLLFSAEQNLLNVSTKILDCDGQLLVGTLEIPFEFILPLGIPNSFNAEFGWTTYSCVTKIYANGGEKLLKFRALFDVRDLQKLDLQKLDLQKLDLQKLDLQNMDMNSFDTVFIDD